MKDMCYNSVAQTRLFYLATNDYIEVNAICSSLKEGSNEINLDDSRYYSRVLAEGGSNRRRQVARQIWDIWHDAYDELPDYLKQAKSENAT